MRFLDALGMQLEHPTDSGEQVILPGLLLKQIHTLVFELPVG